MRKYVPLRNFIYDRLYNPSGGYFCRQDFQVGELSSPINFKSLIGFDDYQEQLYKRYPKNAWMTPSQIFKPYYGMSIAHYIVQASLKQLHRKNPKLDLLLTQQKLTQPIRIIEAGAGTGSAAQSILFYFQNYEQQLFKNIEYTIVEISPILCAHIERKLKKIYPRLFQKGQIKIINKDINKYKNNSEVFVVFLEVFDNLPHDRVILGDVKGEGEVGASRKFSIVDLDSNQEKFQDIQKDALVKQCLQLYQKYQKFGNKPQPQPQSFLDKLTKKLLQKYYTQSSSSPSTQSIFLPTYSLQLLQSLNKNIPKNNLIISDFDSLLSNIEGKNAPIVSFKGQKSADKKDYSTYLVNRGTADIFFPVDFPFLKFMIENVMGRESTVMKSYQFFQEFQVDGWVESKSGFNPLREDFANTSFLVSKI